MAEAIHPMEIKQTTLNWLLGVGEASGGAEWEGVKEVHSFNLCSMRASMTEIDTNRLTGEADNVDNETLVQSCQSFQTIQWIFYSRNVFAYAFAGLFIMVTSVAKEKYKKYALEINLFGLLLTALGLAIGLKMDSGIDEVDKVIGRFDEFISAGLLGYALIAFSAEVF